MWAWRAVPAWEWGWGWGWASPNPAPGAGGSSIPVLITATTATAFGSLWLSSHPGTASMGKLLAISLLTTMMAAALFQPVLMGPPRDPKPKKFMRRIGAGAAAARSQEAVAAGADKDAKLYTPGFSADEDTIKAVGEKLKGVNRKNRVTVYYMLADHFGKLDLFR